MATAASSHALRYLLVGAASVKIAVVGVGYVLYKVASPAGAHSRENFLAHTEELIKVLSEQGHEPSQDMQSALRENIALLRERIKKGWREPDELSAFGHVLAFVSWAHTTDTANVLSEIMGSYARKTWGAFERGADAVFDSIFEAFFTERDKEGNVRM
jgi:hypothetical protein